MVEIGGKPILWHILSIFAHHGITDSVICCGYKGEIIKDYFTNYATRNGDLTVDMATGKLEVHRQSVLPWKVTLADTGKDTMTGGRLKRACSQYIGRDETFCCTYGDGVADIDINQLIDFHRTQKSWATLSATRPPGRFGSLALDHAQEKVTHFSEKTDGDTARINAGFFAIDSRAVREYVKGDETIWEKEPLSELAHAGRLSAYKHDGFWHPMDTLRDKHILEEYWASGSPPWKIWS